MKKDIQQRINDLIHQSIAEYQFGILENIDNAQVSYLAWRRYEQAEVLYNEFQTARDTYWDEYLEAFRDNFKCGQDYYRWRMYCKRIDRKIYSFIETLDKSSLINLNA